MMTSFNHPDALEFVALARDSLHHFTHRELDWLIHQPGSQLARPQLINISQQLQQLGILANQEADGWGLWQQPDKSQQRQFSLEILTNLARYSPALAWHVHQTGLCDWLITRLGWSNITAMDCCLIAQGHYGLASEELANWIANTRTQDQVLCDWFDASRGKPVYHPGNWLYALQPVWQQGTLQWQCVRREHYTEQVDKQALGLTPLQLSLLSHNPQGLIDISSELAALESSALYADLLTWQQLGLLAIAWGACQPICERTLDYTQIRRQGGKLIQEHHAVQAMQADLYCAVHTGEQLLNSFAQRENITLLDVTQTRLALHPLLVRAVDQAIQAHGGIGYLPDTGIERGLRDQWTLATLCGSEFERQQLIVHLTRPTLINSPIARSGLAFPERQALEGQLPINHDLYPTSHYRSLSLLGRWLADYPPQDLWQRDTETLPPALRQFRLRCREFAHCYLRPLASHADLLPHSFPGDYDERHSAVLRQAAKQGMLSLGFPAPLGSGRSNEFRYPLGWKFALLTEEFARADGGLMLMLCAHYLGMVPLWLAGDSDLIRRTVLEAHHSMRGGTPHLFAYAITEPAGGSDVEDGYGAMHHRPGVTAHRTQGGWVLSGRKCFISGGDLARDICVFAALDKEDMSSWTCFRVRVPCPGFRVVNIEHKMGMRASHAAELLFDQVFVADRDVVGRLRQGWTLNRATLNASRLPVAGMAVGLAAAATELAVDFCGHYRVAGKRLLDRQHVQLRIADMLTETRALRAYLWHTARSSRQPHQLDAAGCKYLITDRAQHIIETGLNLLDNHAGRHAVRMEKCLRDIRLTRIFEGTNQINRLAVIEDWQPQLLDFLNAQKPLGV